MSKNEFNFNGPREKDLKKIFFNYLQYWYLFLLSIALCLFFAIIHIRYYTTPEFYISSTILIKDKNNNIFSPSSAEGLGGLSQNKNLGNEILILKSNNLMRKVINELGLNVSYFVEGKFSNFEIYEADLPISTIIHSLDSSAYGKSLRITFLDNNQFKIVENDNNESDDETIYKFGKQVVKKYGSFTVFGPSDTFFSNDIIIKFNNPNDLSKHYSNSLIVNVVNENSNVIRLALKDNIPQRSVQILNKLKEVYDQEAIEDKTQVELNTIDFLDERIQFLSIEISNVEKDVEIYKRENSLINVESNAQMYMQTASEYNRELVNIELQLEILQSIENYFSQDKLRLIPNSLNISNPVLTGLIGKFNELQLERQRLLRTIQPGSAMIQNIDDQIVNLKFNIIENLRNIKNELTLTRNNFKKSSSQYQTKVRSVPSLERELQEINRQQGIKQAIYLFLLQKREESALSLAASVSNSRVIDQATALDFPVSPNKRNIYMISLMLGLAIPIAGIYFKDLLNDKIQSKADIERATSVTVLGEIIHNETKDILVATEKSRTSLAELFRLISTNLAFSTYGCENKVILVTSSMSGEGKTFFSINLAATLAQAGKKVVVIGFDFRMPRLLEDLGISFEKGITNYLVSDHITLDEIIKPISQVNNLFVIGSGPIPPNPAVVLHSKKIKELISLLKDNFDYLILDSAPVGLVADTYLLAPYIDATIFLVRLKYTYKTQLDIVQEIYENKKLKNPMIVINDAQIQNGKYGYGYGKKKKFFFLEKI